MNILFTRKLSFSYPGFRDFHLSNICLSFNPGLLTGIMGPNGSGKTTLLKLLSGHLRPSSGEVLLDGRPISSYGHKERSKKITYVPQSLHFVFPFTVWDLVCMGRYPHKGFLGLNTIEDIRICEQALELCDAERFKNRFYNELSSGERQRIVLASALAQNPEVLLLDEPTTGLDIYHQKHLFDLLRRFSKLNGICVICTIHDLNNAARFLPNVAIIKNGRIKAVGPPSLIFTSRLIHNVYGVRFKRVNIPGNGFFLTPSSRSNP